MVVRLEQLYPSEGQREKEREGEREMAVIVIKSVALLCR